MEQKRTAFQGDLTMRVASHHQVVSRTLGYGGVGVSEARTLSARGVGAFVYGAMGQSTQEPVPTAWLPACNVYPCALFLCPSPTVGMAPRNFLRFVQAQAKPLGARMFCGHAATSEEGAP